MVSHDRCPLCSSYRLQFYLRCTDHLLSRKEFDISRCTECGFTFTRDYPDEKDIGAYYASDEYVSHDDRASGFLNRVYLFSRNLMLRKKGRIVRAVTGKGNGKLLDIGCGTGYFAGSMKKSGWDVTGIEPNEKAREFGVSNFGINAFHPDKIAELPDKSFDCITLWHVLEHLHEPFKYASEIKRMLKTDGVCIIALPNSGSADARHYGKSWAAYDVPRHLWHFNASTIGLFSEKAGFKITGIRRLPLDVFYISILSEKFKNFPLPLLKGGLMGVWFSFRSVISKVETSSLVFVLKKTDIQ